MLRISKNQVAQPSEPIYFYNYYQRYISWMKLLIEDWILQDFLTNTEVGGFREITFGTARSEYHASQCVYSMLAKEYDLNDLFLIKKSCLQAEVFQIPALNKHKQRWQSFPFFRTTKNKFRC